MPQEFKVKNGLIVDQGGATITGSVIATGGFTGSLQGTASNALTASFIDTASTNAFVQGGNSFGATALLGTNDNQSLAFETSGSTRMLISGSGVGIGKTPQSGFSLDANSNIVTRDSFYVNNDIYFFGASNSNIRITGLRFTDIGTSTTQVNISTAGNLGIGIGTTAASSRLQVRGSGATSATTALRVENTNASASMVVLDNGFVGINTGSAQYNLDVNGTARVTGEANVSFLSLSGNTAVNSSGTTLILGASGGWAGVRVPRYFETTGSISAAAAIARGTYLNQTLVATANNDVLVGLDIQPTFTTGAFTGVQSIALRLPNGGRITNASTISGYNVYIASTETTLNSPISTGTIGFQLNYGFVGRFMGTTGNFILQNGGTFTDAGFKLDVSGSGRFTNGLTVTGSLIAPSITGSLQGTASYATQALSASWAPSVASNPFPFTGSAIISGSLTITGSFDVGVPGTNSPRITSVGTLNRGDIVSVDWVNKNLQDSTTTSSLNWESRALYDSLTATSIDWNGRLLVTPGTGESALDYSNDLFTVSNIYNQQITRTNTIGESLSDTLLNYSGHSLQANVTGSAISGNIVYLDTDGMWKTVNQATVTSTKMLGIKLTNPNDVLLEGDVVLEASSMIKTPAYGAPLYIWEGGTVLSSDIPTSGYVRILGHCYYQNTGTSTNWIVKFRPSNDWYEI